MTHARSWLQRYAESRFFFLLLSILMLLLLLPFLQHFQYGESALRLFFAVTVVTSLYSISNNKRKTLVGLLIGFPALAAVGSSFQFGGEGLLAGRFLVTVGFFLFVTLNVLRHVLADGEVTAEKIYGALCVYLLLGLLWACGYFALELLRPGSLQFDGVALATVFEVRENMFYQCLYYSYVTLTTLGYGDVKPMTAPAQSLAYVEALTGQLYLAVLVARLVALHIASSGRK